MAHLQLDDTIAALASAPGAAGRGIVRLTGPEAVRLMTPIFVPQDRSSWESAAVAAVHFGELYLTVPRAPIPVLIYVWPTRHSYTGQPSVEIHAPGSPPVLEAILAELFAA